MFLCFSIKDVCNVCYKKLLHQQQKWIQSEIYYHNIEWDFQQLDVQMPFRMETQKKMSLWMFLLALYQIILNPKHVTLKRNYIDLDIPQENGQFSKSNDQVWL